MPHRPWNDRLISPQAAQSTPDPRKVRHLALLGALLVTCAPALLHAQATSAGASGTAADSVAPAAAVETPDTSGSTPDSPTDGDVAPVSSADTSPAAPATPAVPPDAQAPESAAEPATAVGAQPLSPPGTIAEENDTVGRAAQTQAETVSSPRGESGTPAATADPTAATPAQTQAATTDPSDPEAEGNPWTTWTHRLGIMLDVGLPDGLALAATYEPLFWGRVDFGVTTNVLGAGLRGGITLAPLDFFITPTFNIDLGHYFKSDISGAVSQIAGEDVDSDMFRYVTYTYLNLHLGLILGGESFRFFLRGGMSRMHLTFSGGEAELSDDSSLRVTQGVKVDVWTPSVKLGVIIGIL